MAIPSYTHPAIPDAVPGLAPRDEEERVDASPSRFADRWASWPHRNGRAAHLGLDVAMIATVVLTFAQSFLPADVMFHVVFFLLTVHAFLFGLRGTLVRIAIVWLPLLAFANARLLGWNQPPFDLFEWPFMSIFAVLVAWMADRRDATAQRYASLFRQASERLLTIEEDERHRIALELHDGVGQVLTALTLTLDAAGETSGSQHVRQQVGAARGLAEAALAEVRHLAHRMRPVRLEERGLAAAIRDLAGQSGFPVRVHVDDALDRQPPALEPSVMVGVYRIVQEALANAARHSGAPMAQVWMSSRQGRLTVLVVDEGCGFDRASTVDLGIGLAGMHERAELLGGRLSIQSAVGRGTSVAVDLPLRTRTS